MIRLPGGKKGVPPEALMRLIWVSTFLAVIFAVPGLAIFVGIYYGTGQLLPAAVVGFGVHFVTLAFSPRISRFVTRLIG